MKYGHLFGTYPPYTHFYLYLLLDTIKSIDIIMLFTLTAFDTTQAPPGQVSPIYLKFDDRGR
jgi:hypothetical protein